MNPTQHLIIPFDQGHAVLPMGISRDDYKRLVKTLKLWKKRMIDPPIKSPQEQEMERVFGEEGLAKLPPFR